MDKKRLIWACRRGMLELDLILEPFLQNVYSDLEPDDQLLYQKLLKEEDQDLFAWLMGHKDPESPELLRIVSIIRDNTGLQTT